MPFIQCDILITFWVLSWFVILILLILWPRCRQENAASKSMNKSQPRRIIPNSFRYWTMHKTANWIWHSIKWRNNWLFSPCTKILEFHKSILKHSQWFSFSSIWSEREGMYFIIYLHYSYFNYHAVHFSSVIFKLISISDAIVISIKYTYQLFHFDY